MCKPFVQMPTINMPGRDNPNGGDEFNTFLNFIFDNCPNEHEEVVIGQIIDAWCHHGVFPFSKIFCLIGIIKNILVWYGNPKSNRYKLCEKHLDILSEVYQRNQSIKFG